MAKTKNEILQWITAHNWHPAFRKMLYARQGGSVYDWLSYCEEERQWLYVISGAFSWGDAYAQTGCRVDWADVNYYYLKWYYNEN